MALKRKAFFSEKNSEYTGIKGVENPMRIERIRKAFDSAGMETDSVPLDRAEAEEAILKVHPLDYVKKIERLSHEPGDPEAHPHVSFQPGLPDVAFNAVNTALKAAREGGFAAIRPPGHHAGKESFSGFCYFNNAAIAAAGLLEKGERVAVIDLDAHYGDGTHALLEGNPDAFYASINADTKHHFPGCEVGKGARSCIIAVGPVNETDEKFLEHIEKVIEAVKAFGPTKVCIDIGFDTFVSDKVMGFSVKDLRTYRKAGKMLAAAFPDSFALLEGGYHDAVGVAAREFFLGWAGSDE